MIEAQLPRMLQYKSGRQMKRQPPLLAGIFCPRIHQHSYILPLFHDEVQAVTNEELALMVQSGNDKQKYLEQLYCQNYGMISKICRKYKEVEDLEDLLQESFFGLQKAAELWKPDGGAAFIGYAVFWIKQSILRYIYNCGSCIRVPSSRRAQIGQYNRVLNDYRLRFGQDPTDQELRALLDLSMDQLKDLKQDVHALRIRSTSEPIGEDGESTLEDFLRDDSGNQYDELIDRIQNEELGAALWKEVDMLPPKDAAVIRDRYKNGRTLKECAESLGCTPQYVKTLHDKALRSLRHGNHLKRLRPFLSDTAAYSKGIRHTGYTSFMLYGSAQEFAAMQMEERTGMNLYYGKEILS